MSRILRQIKARRLELGFKQNDMPMRIGMSRQQYNRLELKGNPRLETLELLAKGLNSELILIPQDKLVAVTAILESGDLDSPSGQEIAHKNLVDNPWEGLLGDD